MVIRHWDGASSHRYRRWAYRNPRLDIAIGASAWLAFVFVLFGILMLPSLARPQDRLGDHGHQHAQQHHWYNELKMPSNPTVSCCDDKDCRPTRAYKNDKDEWVALVDGNWIVVPKRAELDPSLNKDPFNAHICASSGGYIYCFLAGAAGI